MITSRSQRWRDRRQVLVQDTTVIDPSEFGAEVIDCYGQAKPFVCRHHYAGTFPASRLSVGLFRKSGVAPARLVGVATFSQPMSNEAVAIRTGLSASEGVELGRLVLLDEVAGNGESYFLARAFRTLRREKPDLISVVSYADPMERRSATGQLIKPGHIGQIYRVMGGAYTGRSKARTELIMPDGHPFSERAASKIRNGETGCGYSVDQLVARGAPRPTDGDLRRWFEALRKSQFFSRRRHPGNLAYTFALTNKARIAIRPVIQALPSTLSL